MAAPASAAAHNRVRDYFDPTADAPTDPQARMAAYDDCVTAALFVLRRRLRSGDDKVAGEAAKLVLAFEQTRMRHGGRVAGCEPPHKPFQEELADFYRENGLEEPERDRDGDEADDGEKVEGRADDAEEEAEAEEKAAAPVYAATAEEAVAAHAEEMLGVLKWGKSLYPSAVEGEPDLATATRSVQAHLQRMNAAATAIPVGRFWKEVGRFRQRCADKAGAPAVPGVTAAFGGGAGRN